MQSCAGGFGRQARKTAAPQSVQAVAPQMHYQAVRQCPGLAPSPLVQSDHPDSVKMNGEERCEEERLINNFPFSVRGPERSRIGHMLLKWEGKGPFKGGGQQSAIAVPWSRSFRVPVYGRWVALAQLMEGLNTQANFENSLG